MMNPSSGAQRKMFCAQIYLIRIINLVKPKISNNKPPGKVTIIARNIPIFSKPIMNVEK